MKIAVILHLYYHDLWEEFSDELKRFNDKPFDLYVTLVEGSDPLDQQKRMKARIYQDYPCAKVFLMENKGLDIGPFLQVMRHFIEQQTEYDFILKLHSKKSLQSCGVDKGADWRKELYHPLLQNIDLILNFLEENSDIGMIGSKMHIYDYEGSNRPAIDYLKELLQIRTDEKNFVGGTMFWIRYSILKEYLNLEMINEIFPQLESGYFSDFGTSRITHAMERIFGYMISDHHKLIAGI